MRQCRYDDLHNYSNERSLWLAALRDRIEEQWQAWELAQLGISIDKSISVEQVSTISYSLRSHTFVALQRLQMTSLDHLGCRACRILQDVLSRSAVFSRSAVGCRVYYPYIACFGMCLR